VNYFKKKFLTFFQDDNGFSEIEDCGSSSDNESESNDNDDSNIEKNDDVENGRRPIHKTDAKKQVGNYQNQQFLYNFFKDCDKICKKERRN